MCMLKKPPSIESDAYKSAKWDELAGKGNFRQSDAPTLSLLCQWHAVIERCMEDMDMGDGLPQVAYQNQLGDIKALPQLLTMKRASEEIRALNKQLGIEDKAQGAQKATVTPLEVVRGKCRGAAGKEGCAKAANQD